MAAMNMVSAGGVLGVSFHLRRCVQGVASVLCKKTSIFGSRRSKLDHLTVRVRFIVPQKLPAPVLDGFKWVLSTVKGPGKFPPHFQPSLFDERR